MTMLAARQGLAWMGTAALLACSTSAWGAEPGPDTLPINVIAVQTADADDQAEALTKALRAAVRATPGWALGEGDYSLEVLTLSLKCPEPPDAGCQARIADQIKSDRYIWGMIQKKGPNIRGDLYLWVRSQGTSKVPLTYSSNLTEANDDALRRIATNAITQLTGGPPKGSFHVKAGNVPGQVFVDGQPVGVLAGGQGTFQVPSGNHRITVKADGYTDGESQVTVRPTGAPVEVTVALLPLEVETPTNWKMIGGFGALGLGAAFGVVGLIQSLQVNALNLKYNQAKGSDGKPGAMYTYRQGKSKLSNVCDDALKEPKSSPLKSVADETLVACKEARTPFALQFVFYPLAALSAGAGAYLLATSLSSDKSATTGIRIDPQFGPGEAKLNVMYTW
jgi:hypothetical protein